MEAGHFMAIKEHQEKVDHAKEQGARYVCGYCHSPIFLEEERFHCIECCSFDCCPSCFVSLKGCQEHINTLHQRSEIFKKHNKRKVKNRKDTKDSCKSQDVFVQETGMNLRITQTASVAEVLDAALRFHAARPCLGVRHVKRSRKQKDNKGSDSGEDAVYNDHNYWRPSFMDIVGDLDEEEKELLGNEDAGTTAQSSAVVGDYTWYTFAAMHSRALHFGRGLSRMQEETREEGKALSVGICLNEPLELFISVIGCILQNLQCVLIEPTMESAERLKVLRENHIACLVTSQDLLSSFLESGNILPPRVIVVGTEGSSTYKDNTTSFEAVEALGQPETPILNTKAESPKNSESLIATFYLPGSCKTVTEGQWGIAFRDASQALSSNIIYHMSLADTQHSLLTLCAGGRIGLPSRTQSALEDIQRLQPTLVIAPTSFIQALQDEFDRQLSQRQQQQQQQSSITEGGRPLLPHAQRIEMLFLREFAKTLGSRLAILAITGTAEQNLLKFVYKCFLPVVSKVVYQEGSHPFDLRLV